MDIEPDVMVVDEVLSVGDERFREKCQDYFHRLVKENKTVLMVSHSLGTLSELADCISVLSKGRIVYQGEPQEALRVYKGKNYQTSLDGQRL
jgi:ABC-2 type transport system ATP-binding protein